MKHLVANSPQNRKPLEACKPVSMIEQFVVPYTQSALKPSISKYQEFINSTANQPMTAISQSQPNGDSHAVTNKPVFHNSTAISQSLTTGQQPQLAVTDSHPNLSCSKKLTSPKILHASIGSSSQVKHPDSGNVAQESRTNLVSASKSGFRKLIVQNGNNGNTVQQQSELTSATDTLQTCL